MILSTFVNLDTIVASQGNNVEIYAKVLFLNLGRSALGLVAEEHEAILLQMRSSTPSLASMDAPSS